MNELIQELAKQATIHSKEGFYTYQQIDPEKFALLVAKECLEIVDDEGCGEGGSVRAIEKIKQRFGVKE